MSNQNDFKSMMAMLSSVYSKAVTPDMIKAYWMMLGEYPSEVVNQAAYKHMKDPKSGQYFPKPADLMRYIDGGDINADMILGLARLKDCPLGVLSAIHIGSYDLDNQDAFYLRQRATECLHLLPQWKARAQNGDYTDHEISIMAKYKVDPCRPFANGLNSPDNKGALADRVAGIVNSERHKFLMLPPYEGSTDDAPANNADIKMLTNAAKID
jgi:hypothetical protein